MMLNWCILALNRLRNRLRAIHVEHDRLLLLVPHCLQRSTCDRNVINDINQCAHCGQCNINDLLEIRDEFGIQCNLAGGGREAVAYVKAPGVKAVIAVACEKELAAGVVAAFPKPVVAVPNLRPHGPCRDCAVDVEELRRVIRNLVGDPPVSTGNA